MKQERPDPLGRIREAFEAGDLDVVRQLLSDCPDTDGTSEFFSMQGILSLLDGQIDTAKSWFEQGLISNPKDPDCHYNLGHIQQQCGNKRVAREHFAASLQHAVSEPQKRDALLALATTSGCDHLNTVERSSSSASLPDKALEMLRTSDSAGLVDIIKGLLAEKRHPAILSLCSKWLARASTPQALPHLFMGVAHNATGQYQASLENHLTALEIDPKLADLRNGKTSYCPPYQQESTGCIGCGSSTLSPVFVVNQSVAEDNKGLVHPIRIWAQCSGCGLIQADPRPSRSMIGKYYDTIAHEKFGGQYGDISTRFAFLVTMSHQRLSTMECMLGGPGSLLDIGAGVGFFVGSAIDRGWTASGLEFTEADCLYAKEHFGLSLIQQDFSEFQSSDEYDAVTLFEVIEHLYAPAESLKKINRLVKMSGLLVVATPILDSLYGKSIKEQNAFWHVVSHLSYFTFDVMRLCLFEAGFEVHAINASQEGMGRMDFFCKKTRQLDLEG